MFGFSKKKFQVNLAPRKRVPPPTTPPPLARDPVLPSKSAIIFIFAGLLFGFLVLGALRWYSEYSQEVPPPESLDPKPAEENILARVVEEVGKQYVLPVDETPTMALITSLDELKGQEFFAKAEVGDVVLMYMEAKKGILWRPTKRQIVEIGPIITTSPHEGDVATSTSGSSEKITQ